MSFLPYKTLTTLSLGLLCTSLSAAEQNRTVADLLTPSAEAEGAFVSKLKEQLQSTDIGGPFYSYQGSAVNVLSPSEVALRVLANNLDIQNSKADSELAAQVLMEAAAVFDPVLTLDIGLDRTESFERTINGTVIETVFNPQYADPNTGLPAGPGEIILPDAVQQETGIESITFNNLQADNESVDDTDVFVSKDSANGAVNALSMTATLEQQTPWGARFSLSLGTLNKKSFYDNAGHSYDAPWASEMLFNIELPLGDMGENSSAALNTRIATIESDRQQWVVKERVNSLLKVASQAYLALVESSQNLLIRQRTYSQTRAQFDATKKRYDRRTATTYELAQIEGELNLRRTQVNSAASGYLVASDTLLSLITDNAQLMQGRVLAPSGYSSWLNSYYDVDDAAALQSAKANRALLQDDKLKVQKANASYQTAQLRSRPDIVLSAELGMQQNGSIIGYESLVDSLSSVFDPDTSTQRLGLTYNYPFKNTARKSQQTVRELQLQDAKLAEQLSLRTVEQEVRESLNQLSTAKHLQSQVLQSLDASSRSWDSLQRLARNGQANQNELINGLRALQAAELAVLSANLDIKRAELAVIAANGTLSKVYANWTARNEFEVQRIAWFDQQANLQFFGGVKK